MVCSELRGEFLDAVTGGHGEAAAVVDEAAFPWSDVVAERVVELVARLLHLLAQRVEFRDHLGAPRVRVHLDVVAHGVAGPNAQDALCPVALLLHDSGEHRLGVAEEAGSLLTDDRVLEDVREATVELPGAEKGTPVDEGHDLV